MLENLRAFWIAAPPDPMIPFTLWQSFRQEALGWMAGLALVGVAMIIGLYILFCRRIVIRTPLDPFLPFVPPRWLALSFAFGAIAAVVYCVRYVSLFQDAAIAPTGGAVSAFAITSFVTYASAQLLIWLPGVTPRKIIYHPRWLWRMLR